MLGGCKEFIGQLRSIAGTEARLYYYEGGKPQSQTADTHLRIVDERRLSTKIQRMKYEIANFGSDEAYREGLYSDW